MSSAEGKWKEMKEVTVGLCPQGALTTNVYRLSHGTAKPEMVSSLDSRYSICITKYIYGERYIYLYI
jgi:hypothetical protein